MKKVLTGIRPTATLTIANLIGAAVPILELQKSDNEILVFVATMHGLTDHEAGDIVESVDEVVRDYLALGLDPKKVTIFDQRAVRRQVALLKLYLERHITVARACRIPTLKDKLRDGQTPEQANVLLMAYPIMMAADILLQEAQIVPVGKDQYSHMEVTRELADSFNDKYGKGKAILVRPETMNRQDPVHILALTGDGKMSKSKPEGAIFLNDAPEVIRKKIMRAETAVEGEMTKKLNSLIEMALSLAPDRVDEIKVFIDKHLDGEKVMGGFKKLLADILVEFTTNFQAKRAKITDAQVHKILADGALVAQANADKVLERVETAMGII
ncbi:MAG: tryptophan--tRNA ligase [Candidatus Falkowbacteria bacterium]